MYGVASVKRKLENYNHGICGPSRMKLREKMKRLITIRGTSIKINQHLLSFVMLFHLFTSFIFPSEQLSMPEVRGITHKMTKGVFTNGIRCFAL
jgi:hypothetical protein